ncbi:uncharacterized protein J3R85_008142 [Psidium guajava]|nr:uncharacterized protein J3R85_008142 [Psidium guajava]
MGRTGHRIRPLEVCKYFPLLLVAAIGDDRIDTDGDGAESGHQMMEAVRDNAAAVGGIGVDDLVESRRRHFFDTDR